MGFVEKIQGCIYLVPAGILIYEMVHGYPPFSDENNLNTYRKILTGGEGNVKCNERNL